MKSSTTATGYNQFIGIDVGKDTLVAHHHGQRKTITFINTVKGIDDFIATYATWLCHAYVVVDTTGGWERELIAALLAQGVAVHSADGRRVKSFARSLGRLAKTDAIDAAILARYGVERHQDLPLCQLADEALYMLQNLVTRRNQLVIYAKEEKQRLSGPLPETVRMLIETSLGQLQDQLGIIENAIATCIASDAILQEKAILMQDLAGIGPHTSALLLADMPELGQLDRRQIAALAGLAPYAYDSGNMTGRRTTYGGRKHIRAALFLAALNGARAKGTVSQEFYNRLIKNGKAKRCALVAVARKMITILNARLKDKFFPQLKNMSR